MALGHHHDVIWNLGKMKGRHIWRRRGIIRLQLKGIQKVALGFIMNAIYKHDWILAEGCIVLISLPNFCNGLFLFIASWSICKKV